MKMYSRENSHSLTNHFCTFISRNGYSAIESHIQPGKEMIHHKVLLALSVPQNKTLDYSFRFVLLYPEEDTSELEFCLKEEATSIVPSTVTVL